MKQTPNDQISAFFDDEIDDAESQLVLRRLTRDQDLRNCISRYAVIGQAVRRDQPAHYHIAERLRVVLAAEPALSAPEAATRPALQRFMRPVIGAAIAATVAVVAIGSLQNIPDAEQRVPVTLVQENPLPYATNATVTPVSAPASAASYTVPSVIPAGRQSMEARRQLNTYLVSHSQYAKRMGPQGIVSFRAVGYQTGAGGVPEPTVNEPRVDTTQ